MKKIVSLLLVLALTMGLATTAFAAVTGTGTDFSDPMVSDDLEAVTVTLAASADPDNWELTVLYMSFPAEAVGYTVTVTATGGASAGDFDVSSGSWGECDDTGVATCEYNGMWGPMTITNYTTSDIELTITLTPPAVGSYMNPDVLTEGNVNTTLEAGNDQGYYYEITAADDGQITLTPTEDELNYDIVVTNVNTYDMACIWDFDEEWNYGPMNEAASVTFSKGDVIRVQVVGKDANYGPAPAVDANFEVVIEYALGTESNPYFIELASDMGGVEAAAGKSTYYVISAMLNGQTLTINAEEGMTVTLNDTELEAVDGVYTAELVGVPTNKLVVTAGETDVTAVASIGYPEGSENNPIVVTVASDLVDVAAGEEVCFLINGQYSGYTLTVEEGAVILVNGEPVEGTSIVLEGTPTIAVAVNGGNAGTEITLTAPVPQTGDAGITMYVAMMVLAGALIAGLTAKKYCF